MGFDLSSATPVNTGGFDLSSARPVPGARIDLAPVYDALRKADAAGNTADAKQLADYIRRVGPQGDPYAGIAGPDPYAGVAHEANPFDQFDLASATPVHRAGGNPFDQFDLSGVSSGVSNAYQAATTSTGTPATASDRVKALAGGMNKWAAGLVGLPGDTILNVWDLLKAGIGTGQGLVTGKAPSPIFDPADRSQYVGSSQWIANQLAKGGISTANPAPQDAASRALYTVGQWAPNALLGGPQTAGQAATNAAMNVGAGFAGQAAHEAFPNSPGAPILASLLAQGAPTMAAAGGKFLLRGPEGGPGQQTVQQNIGDFESAGAGVPTVGQATERPSAQGLENLVSKIPGGYGVMRNVANRQAQGISEEVSNIAGGLSSRGTAEQAGRAIERGVTGSGGFVEQFRETQADLYNKLDQYIPQGTVVGTDNARAALSRLNAPIPGAPNVSQLFQNPKLQAIESALTSDATLPYGALKQLRTLVGSELNDWTITNNVPKSQWSALYAGLSEDLKSAAAQAGPDALQAWNRANNYTRAGMDRIDTIQRILDRNGGPEAIFNAALSGTKTGATTLRSVLQSLPVDAQKSIAATVLNRMGRANPSNQNDLGTAFSTERFLTNLTALSPEAKSALFGRFGSASDVSAISRVADNLRTGSKVLANPSGTGPASAAYGTLGAAGTALVTGHPFIAASALAPVPMSWLAARAMASPSLVNSLARPTALSQPRAFSAALQQAQFANQYGLAGLNGSPVPYVTQ